MSPKTKAPALVVSVPVQDLRLIAAALSEANRHLSESMPTLGAALGHNEKRARVVTLLGKALGKAVPLLALEHRRLSLAIEG